MDRPSSHHSLDWRPLRVLDIVRFPRNRSSRLKTSPETRNKPHGPPASNQKIAPRLVRFPDLPEHQCAVKTTNAHPRLIGQAKILPPSVISRARCFEARCPRCGDDDGGQNGDDEEGPVHRDILTRPKLEMRYVFRHPRATTSLQSWPLSRILRSYRLYVPTSSPSARI